MALPTSEDIKRKAFDLGFTKAGIVPAQALTDEGARLDDWLSRNFHGKMGYMERDRAKRSDPRLLLPSAKSVICVALNYYRQDKHENSPDKGKVSRYAWGDDYHEILQTKLKALRDWLLEIDATIEAKICVDTAPIMDKAWAVRAGIGWLGKHTNVLTRDFGSWVFLGEMLVSAELEYESRIEKDHCGNCTACIDACPTGAIVAPYQLDAARCISYGTIELRADELPVEIGDHLDGWVFGCDVCQDVCPWTRFSKESAEPGFKGRPGITDLNLEEIAAMTQEEFSARFKGSAIKRAKVTGLRRNARALLATGATNFTN